MYTVTRVRLTQPPRSWADPHYEFGRNAAIWWRTTTSPTDEAEVAAAQMQHDYLIRARVRMVTHADTYDTLANKAGIDASVLGKVFRGDRPLHLVHLAAPERVLGPLRGP